MYLSGHHSLAASSNRRSFLAFKGSESNAADCMTKNNHYPAFKKFRAVMGVAWAAPPVSPRRYIARR